MWFAVVLDGDQVLAVERDGDKSVVAHETASLSLSVPPLGLSRAAGLNLSLKESSDGYSACALFPAPHPAIEGMALHGRIPGIKNRY